MLHILIAETISNLKRLIKHSWMVRGKVEKGHLIWKDKATREQISRARQLREDRITEDLCDANHISAALSKTKMHM